MYLIDSNDCVNEMGEWVIEEAIVQIKQWKIMGLKFLRPVGLNVFM
jgi:EAL domain-containing protein (putative c-di-GMP-specific phosphodiesterase class I)